MKDFFKRIASFFSSLLLLLGMVPAGVGISASRRFPIIDLHGADVTNGYTVSIPSSSGSVRFNRVSFSYETTAPLRAVFTYRQGFGVSEEELLLSSKAHKASMLLDGYLRRKTASRLICVRFEPIVANTPCTLSVSGFTCDVQNVPRGDVLYIENDRYKAGVKLDWGGGLCYFSDKKDDRYDNLLNCHDTGRLVQQSYYGPGRIDGYQNGVYMDYVWPYNPVQGGDQYGNKSKLVALETTASEIRVVCRPLDWALANEYTQTYYTCVYTLTESGMTVRNTAVDFLQTEWPAKNSQEIPALYTISALNNFWFYDGSAPWTDAPLRAERDLPFWGNAPGFDLQAGNSETWCAWADDADYGLGIYTPAATCLKAGRFCFDGSTDPLGNPTNYVAPLGFFALRFDEPFTYSFYLTTGSVREIRETFRAAAAAGGE